MLLRFVGVCMFAFVADALFFPQILFSDARVLGLGPRFMSVYIQKLAVSDFFCYTLHLLLVFQCSCCCAFRLSDEYTMMKLKG